MNLRNVVFLFLAAASVALIALAPLKLAQAQSKSPVTRWEYKVVVAIYPPDGDHNWLKVPGVQQDQLDKLGDQGWELTGLSFDQSATRYFYLKRPRHN